MASKPSTGAISLLNFALENREGKLRHKTMAVLTLNALEFCHRSSAIALLWFTTGPGQASRLWSQMIHSKALMALVVTGLLAGCINTPLPDYYVLTPENGKVNFRGKFPGIAVGIGPITIPETLNRSNIVTPRDSNQLVVAEYHRWSEPLRDNISRVLITNLAARTGLDKLYAYPWLGNNVDYQLRVDVLQMTGTLKDSVYLQVRWQVLTGTKPAKIIRTRIRDYRESVENNSYSSMVAAYSRTYATLSDDISTELAEISRQ